jgi:hypothetical protein
MNASAICSLGIPIRNAEHFHQHALVFGELALCKSEHFNLDASGQPVERL